MISAFHFTLSLVGRPLLLFWWKRFQITAFPAQIMHLYKDKSESTRCIAHTFHSGLLSNMPPFWEAPTNFLCPLRVLFINSKSGSMWHNIAWNIEVGQSFLESCHFSFKAKICWLAWTFFGVESFYFWYISVKFCILSSFRSKSWVTGSFIVSESLRCVAQSLTFNDTSFSSPVALLFWTSRVWVSLPRVTIGFWWGLGLEDQGQVWEEGFFAEKKVGLIFTLNMIRNQ